MTSQTVSGVRQPADQAPESWLDRNFIRILLAIAAAGLIPRLILGNSQPIGFDGWWHLFAATQDSWRPLWGEWRGIAHPPLFYPLLRFAAEFGHSPLLMRSVGIASGCAACVVIGIVASKICRYKAAALLAASAYTFAWSIMEMNCDLRAYPLALLFILLAFNAYLDWLASPSAPHAGTAIVRFGVYSSFAILSEYYVVFFLAGCLAILLLRAFVKPDFRAAWLHSIRVDWNRWMFSIAAPSSLFLLFFAFHMHIRPLEAPYLEKFNWKSNSEMGLDWFLLSNLGKEIGYFAPFELDSGLILALILLLFLPALLYFAFWRKDLWRGAVSAAAPMLLAALLVQLVVLSLANKYPFGGEFRHQSIVAPFVFLSAFLLLDLMGGAMKSALARNALFLAAGLSIAASFAYGWTGYSWNAREVKTDEYSRFRALFPNPENIYVDLSSTIFYFRENHRSKWTFAHWFQIEGQRIDAYLVDDGTGHPIRLLRNKSKPWIDLMDPQTYRILAGALRREGLHSAVLFFEGEDANDEGVKLWAERSRALAPLAGLEYGRSAVSRDSVFIEFLLREAPPRE
jgi:hypothetical protein